jgi:hypothetical protein
MSPRAHCLARLGIRYKLIRPEPLLLGVTATGTLELYRNNMNYSNALSAERAERELDSSGTVVISWHANDRNDESAAVSRNNDYSAKSGGCGIALPDVYGVDLVERASMEVESIKTKRNQSI